MKKTALKTTWLGVFVTLGVLLFIWGIYFVGQKQHLFGRTFRLRSVFKDVNGLQVGNNVRFSGINLGTVEQILIINDTSVQVQMVIDETARRFIKKDARASIGSEGLMGNKIVTITPGTQENSPVHNNDYLQTTQPINLDDVFQKLQLTADNAAVITSDLADIMDNIRSGKGTVGKLFMDSSFAKDIDQTVINLKQGAGGFKENMDAARHSFLLKHFLKKKKK